MWRHAPLPSDPSLSYSELSDNEPEDNLRCRCAYLAPDPYTGTDYPHGSMHLEKIWAGPSLEDVMTKISDKGTMFYNLEQTTFYLENLLEPSKASLRTAPYVYSGWEFLRSLQRTPKDAEVHEAIRRLQHIPKLVSWGPDIIYKAFDDLDLVLFGGALRGGCKLRWTDTATFVADNPDLEPMDGWGVTCNERISPRSVALPHETAESIHAHYWPSRSCIHLNARKHFLEPIKVEDRSRWDEMWGSLLHEMVHAYLRLTIMPTRRDFEWADPQGIHGKHFQRCIRAINARAEALGLGIGGLFEDTWAVEVEGCWLDVYGTAWPYVDEDEETDEDEESSPSTAATSPSLGASDASCLELATASDFSLMTPEHIVTGFIDALTRPEHTLAKSIHARV
ncbi:hypothetical protein MMC11_004041 [Xylographa trunciseda]|nr:hypothetical protein [Xylographa trunciseda]